MYKMNVVQWKSRRTAGVILGLVILYLTIRVRNYEHKMIVLLPKVHPNEAWEFVADFSNMKYLNPTITFWYKGGQIASSAVAVEDRGHLGSKEYCPPSWRTVGNTSFTCCEFSITEESGNYDHWEYTIEYSERLSHWPHLSNYATAYFQVKATPKKDAYFINSLHRTCMFANVYCLDSESEFKFTMSNQTNEAICEETVIYQCPAVLTSFCRREVQYQRNAIMNNLKKKFKIH